MSIPGWVRAFLGISKGASNSDRHTSLIELLEEEKGRDYAEYGLLVALAVLAVAAVAIWFLRK